jgi:hypothetical protein
MLNKRVATELVELMSRSVLLICTLDKTLPYIESRSSRFWHVWLRTVMSSDL